MHLADVRRALEGGAGDALAEVPLAVSPYPRTGVDQGMLRRRLGPAELASAQLFHGETEYWGEEVQGALGALVHGRKEEAEALVDMRGRMHLFARSDLQQASEQEGEKAVI